MSRSIDDSSFKKKDSAMTILYEKANAGYYCPEGYYCDLVYAFSKIDDVIKKTVNSKAPLFIGSVVASESSIFQKSYIRDSIRQLCDYFPDTVQSIYEENGQLFVAEKDNVIEIKQLSEEGYKYCYDVLADDRGRFPFHIFYNVSNVTLFQGIDNEKVMDTRQNDFLNKLWNNPQYTVPIHYSERLKAYEQAQEPAQTQARGINDLRAEKTQESKALSGGQNYDKEIKGVERL